MYFVKVVKNISGHKRKGFYPWSFRMYLNISKYNTCIYIYCIRGPRVKYLLKYNQQYTTTMSRYIHITYRCIKIVYVLYCTYRNKAGYTRVLYINKAGMLVHILFIRNTIWWLQISKYLCIYNKICTICKLNQGK